MDIRAYIQSGIIEGYVLGIASDEEIAEIEQYKKQYTEVQVAIDDFSESLQRRAFEDAVQPPADLKASLIKSLAAEFRSTENNTLVVEVNNTAKQDKPTPPPVYKFWRFATAASVILLLTSAALNIYLFNRYSSTSEQYQALLTERNTLQARNGVSEATIREWETAAQMMADTSVKMVKMPGVAGKQGLIATVFWNTRSNDVYLMAADLPQPPADKQYQLWGIVDGKPVDAGMVDPNCTAACKMKNVSRPQAFAITLERKGGSPSPTMEQMFVMGKI